MEKYRKIILAVSATTVIIALVYWIWPRGEHGAGLSIPDEEIQEVNVLYGIDYTDLMMQDGTIENGQTISHLFSTYGVSPLMIDRTVKAAESVFSLRNIRAGNNYTAFFTLDSIPKLKYFVYEQNIMDYMVISYEGDSVAVRTEHKDVVSRRRKASGTIETSLWNSMIDAGMSPALTKNFEDIYQWTIDFFAIQKNDHFTVIYDELQIDGTPVGVGQIWGAMFSHYGKDYYAIPFKQEGKIEFWDENGNSLRKSMLKVPLNYSRISSRFSNARMHPVLRIVRAHHGVDYAAPAGTPVVAVADGVVTFRGWDGGGGGNTLKIKHSSNLVTGYLHLRGFAPGIVVGKRVSQGDLIGYVGSTGVSTGSHLDYRVWRDGKAIDPLKITSEPGVPISSGNRADYEIIKERVLAELGGSVADSLKVTQLDSVWVYRQQVQPPAAEDAQ